MVQMIQRAFAAPLRVASGRFERLNYLHHFYENLSAFQQHVVFSAVFNTWRACRTESTDLVGIDGSRTESTDLVGITKNQFKSINIYMNPPSRSPEVCD